AAEEIKTLVDQRLRGLEFGKAHLCGLLVSDPQYPLGRMLCETVYREWNEKKQTYLENEVLRHIAHKAKPENDQKVIELRQMRPDGTQRSWSQIAKILGLKSGDAAKKRYNRALERQRHPKIGVYSTIPAP